MTYNEALASIVDYSEALIQAHDAYCHPRPMTWQECERLREAWQERLAEFRAELKKAKRVAR